MSKHRYKKRFKKTPVTVFTLMLLVIGLIVIFFAAQQRQDQRSNAAAPAGADLTDRTNLSFTANNYTSTYHLYAANLDWNKPVGMLIYTDGSGENGLKNPTSSYLMGGSTGMIAVAKKHNMVLLTPLSPNKACSDGDGSCWYLGDSPGYTKWAESLVTSIQSQYSIDKKRVAFGGYSSGAQLATEFWVPSGAAERTMDDGVIVAISYGGSPKVPAVAFSSGFKSNVHINWNTGSQDEAYTTSGEFGVKAGSKYYTDAGFQTSLDVVQGKGHDRTGEFGKIMDAQITKHVSAATGGAPLPSAGPTYFCGGSNTCVPSLSPTPTGTSSIPPTKPLNAPATGLIPSQIAASQTPLDNPTNRKSKETPPDNKQGLFARIITLLQELLQLLISLFK